MREYDESDNGDAMGFLEQEYAELSAAEKVRAAHPRLRQSVYDPGFVYRRAHETDIRATFKRLSAIRVIPPHDEDVPF